MSQVTLDISGHLAILTLNRPEKRNALTPSMLESLEEHCNTLESHPDVRATILSGAGDHAFCSGADIQAWAALDALGMWKQWIPYGQRILQRIENLRQPVIAVINGYALGGGLELALACDIRIAVDSATFAMPEVKIATVAGWGGTERLPKIIGVARAKMMILTGQSIDTDTALNWGLITQVYRRDELWNAGLECASAISKNAPIAVQVAKQLIHGEHAPLESVAGSLTAYTTDGQEGVKSFTKRRPPEYSGT